VTPYNHLITAAKALLVVVGVLLLAAFLLGMMAKAATVTGAGAALYAKAKLLAQIALALSLVVTALGAAIMAMGQTTQGLIFTGIGALLAVLSYVATEKYTPAAPAAQAAAGSAGAPAAEALTGCAAF
ncbi:MAG: hypothetical protein HY554_01445, partial [Elusimicrobia bacterium]|nr:hypothetical protein [Elusimicrobiota bacterium]